MCYKYPSHWTRREIEKHKKVKYEAEALEEFDFRDYIIFKDKPPPITVNRKKKYI